MGNLTQRKKKKRKNKVEAFISIEVQTVMNLLLNSAWTILQGRALLST